MITLRASKEISTPLNVPFKFLHNEIMIHPPPVQISKYFLNVDLLSLIIQSTNSSVSHLGIKDLFEQKNLLL